MLAPATTKLQTPLPPIEINHLYTIGYVIRFRSLHQAPDRVETKACTSSTALALRQIRKKSNSFSFVKP
jgi:hypothetical protein